MDADAKLRDIVSRYMAAPRRRDGELDRRYRVSAFVQREMNDRPVPSDAAEWCERNPDDDELRGLFDGR